LNQRGLQGGKNTDEDNQQSETINTQEEEEEEEDNDDSEGAEGDDDQSDDDNSDNTQGEGEENVDDDDDSGGAETDGTPVEKTQGTESTVGSSAPSGGQSPQADDGNDDDNDDDDGEDDDDDDDDDSYDNSGLKSKVTDDNDDDLDLTREQLKEYADEIGFLPVWAQNAVTRVVTGGDNNCGTNATEKSELPGAGASGTGKSPSSSSGSYCQCNPGNQCMNGIVFKIGADLMSLLSSDYDGNAKEIKTALSNLAADMKAGCPYTHRSGGNGQEEQTVVHSTKFNMACQACVCTPIQIENNDTDSSCFDGDANLHLRDGGVVTMNELKVGDRIKTMSGFEPVIGFLHKENTKEQINMMEIVHEFGTLYVTPGHHLFLSDGSSIPASMLKVNEHQLLVGDSHQLFQSQNQQPSKILQIDTIIRNNGLYAPLTPSGTLVVDGVASSSYADVGVGGSWLSAPHALSQAALTPVRWVMSMHGFVESGGEVVRMAVPVISK